MLLATAGEVVGWAVFVCLFFLKEDQLITIDQGTFDQYEPSERHFLSTAYTRVRRTFVSQN